MDDGSEGWYSHPSHSVSMMVACSTVGSGGDGVPMTPVCGDPPGQKIDGKNFSLAPHLEEVVVMACLRPLRTVCGGGTIQSAVFDRHQPSFELGHDTGARPEGSNWTPRTRTFGKRAVGFVQVVPWDLRFSGTQSVLGVQPAATWGEKVGRTIEITRLQGIGNIDSCFTKEFVLLPLF
ncbi:hypothetical protein BGY98DRAFT_1182341 [Russula aff. rugulosa BPL654]|nr:hypothetical protein BGY98DRAFT_1182341 [Russula aff. rugulosa BPL654]